MDHGELNIPLAKRGNIDAQLDAYKAANARAAKVQAKEAAAVLRANRARAAEVLARMPADQLQRIADKASLTVVRARKELKSMAFFTPLRVIALAVAA